MQPSQSAPYGAASSPIGGAKGCVGSGTLNNNFQLKPGISEILQKDGSGFYIGGG